VKKMINEPTQPTPFYFKELKQGKEKFIKYQKKAKMFKTYKYITEEIKGVKMTENFYIGKVINKNNTEKIKNLYKNLKEVKQVGFTEKGTIAFFNQENDLPAQIQSNLIKISEIKKAKIFSNGYSEPILFKINNKEYLVAPILEGGNNYFDIKLLKNKV